MRHINIADRAQGRGDDGLFGYCGIYDRGGQFFTWMPTLRETLETIEDDTTDPPHAWPRRAYQEVRGFVRREWATGYRCRGMK